MSANISTLLIIGLAICIGFLGGKASKRLNLPLVIGYVIIGALLGKSFLNIISPELINRTYLLNDLTLGIIAFLIGGELNFLRLKKLGKIILSVAVFESLGAFFMVSVFSYFLIKKIYFALILGAVASATAPAATVAVINQYRAKGPLTTTILGVVGSDDAIALIIYAFASSLAYMFLVHKHLPVVGYLLRPLKEVLVSLGLGGGIGVALSYFLNRLRVKEEYFALAIGSLLIAEGLAIQFNLSELLTVMAMAIVGVNLSSRKFESVAATLNTVGFPLIAAFFFLAGARLDIHLLPRIGLLGLVYILARLTGKFLGANLGARLAGAPSLIRRYIGLCLWPQIGIAVALAIVVERDFGFLGTGGYDLAVLTMNVLLFTTIFTEVFGPIATYIALNKAGEIKKI